MYFFLKCILAASSLSGSALPYKTHTYMCQTICIYCTQDTRTYNEAYSTL